MTAKALDALPSGLPAGLVAYKRTDEFTPDTVPAGLKKDHSTKAGTWGLIHVTAGRVLYRVTDDRRASSETMISPNTPPGIVEPTILHRVALMEGARFFVEFWRSSSDEAARVRDDCPTP